MTETFYDVLGVEEDATQEEITAAYRQKVKEYHPDVSDDPDASEVFKKVVQAEEVLGDERERARYDDLGHARYVATVDDQNVERGEHSPWTSGDARKRARERGFGGFGGSEAGGSGGSGTSADSRADGAGRATGSAGGGTTNASVGFGTAAGRQASANWTGGETGNRWSADSYASGGAGVDGDSTYSVHDWEEEVQEPNTVTVDVTQEKAVVAALMFLLYPVFVWATLNPLFPLVMNLTVGICTVLAVGYFLTLPRVGVAIFGTWSVLGPLGVLLFTDWGLGVGLLAVGACWIPFAYSLVVAYFTWPD